MMRTFTWDWTHFRQWSVDRAFIRDTHTHTLLSLVPVPEGQQVDRKGQDLVMLGRRHLTRRVKWGIHSSLTAGETPQMGQLVLLHMCGPPHCFVTPVGPAPLPSTMQPIPAPSLLADDHSRYFLGEAEVTGPSASVWWTGCSIFTPSLPISRTGHLELFHLSPLSFLNLYSRSCPGFFPPVHHHTQQHRKRDPLDPTSSSPQVALTTFQRQTSERAVDMLSWLLPASGLSPLHLVPNHTSAGTAPTTDITAVSNIPRTPLGSVFFFFF